MNFRSIHIACAVLAISACDTSDNDIASTSSVSEQGQALSQAAALPTGDIKGFLHSFGMSKFRAGAAPGELSEFGLNKVMGDEGSFAVDPRNGSVRAVLDADAEGMKNFRPLTTSNETHNKHTLDYFQGAGLPANQVSDVQAFPSMRGGRSASGTPSADTLVDIASVVHRKVNGIAVPDSFAWAIFNAEAQTVQEAVHWPAIKASIIAQAVALQQKLASADSAQAFKDLLPREVASLSGEVAIRHGSTAEADSAPFASYDVVVGEGRRQQTHHYDAAGKLLVHPSARNDGAGTKKDTK